MNLTNPESKPNPVPHSEIVNKNKLETTLGKLSLGEKQDLTRILRLDSALRSFFESQAIPEIGSFALDFYGAPFLMPLIEYLPRYDGFVRGGSQSQTAIEVLKDVRKKHNRKPVELEFYFKYFIPVGKYVDGKRLQLSEDQVKAGNDLVQAAIREPIEEVSDQVLTEGLRSNYQRTSSGLILQAKSYVFDKAYLLRKADNLAKAAGNESPD